jgi:hypothetical protein
LYCRSQHRCEIAPQLDAQLLPAGRTREHKGLARLGDTGVILLSFLGIRRRTVTLEELLSVFCQRDECGSFAIAKLGSGDLDELKFS